MKDEDVIIEFEARPFLRNEEPCIIPPKDLYYQAHEHLKRFVGIPCTIKIEPIEVEGDAEKIADKLEELDKEYLRNSLRRVEENLKRDAISDESTVLVEIKETEEKKVK